MPGSKVRNVVNLRPRVGPIDALWTRICPTARSDGKPHQPAAGYRLIGPGAGQRDGRAASIA